jgi:Galactocerebrosidase, C-terminal lectin domain
VLTQTAAGEPVEWQYPGRSPAPYAIIGANAWRDYTVSARVILPVGGTGSQGAGLIARFEGFRGSAVSQFRGYELRVRGNGAWQLVANGPAAVRLASGSVAAARAYALSLTNSGTIISAQINGVLVATVTNRMYRYGPAGLESLGYYPVRYPSFTIGHHPGTGPHRLARWRRSPQIG